MRGWTSPNMANALTICDEFGGCCRASPPLANWQCGGPQPRFLLRTACGRDATHPGHFFGPANRAEKILCVMTLLWQLTLTSFRRGEPERLGRDANPGPFFWSQDKVPGRFLARLTRQKSPPHPPRRAASTVSPISPDALAAISTSARCWPDNCAVASGGMTNCISASNRIASAAITA